VKLCLHMFYYSNRSSLDGLWRWTPVRLLARRTVTCPCTQDPGGDDQALPAKHTGRDHGVRHLKLLFYSMREGLSATHSKNDLSAAQYIG